MKTAESKTTKSNQHLQAKTGAQQPFFQAQNEQQVAFFGQETAAAKPFFTPSIQTKLSIGQPGDKYEQEADAMAEKVVQKLADDNIQSKPNSETSTQQNQSSTSSSPAQSVTPSLQLKCAECAKEEELQKKEEGPKEATLQMKPIFDSNVEPPDEGALQRKCSVCGKEESIQRKGDSGPSTASSDLESQLNANKGGGSPLPEGTRSQMEGAFGADFSGVRVHTNPGAVQMNKELEAQAFTHGSDLYFNSGKYDPGSTDGNRLLAHELTHTLQQSKNIAKSIQRNPTENPPLLSKFFSRYPRFIAINANDSKVMQNGDKGLEIKVLQKALLLLNYSLPNHQDDGKFGGETRDAVKNFQRDVGFDGEEVDGIVGHKTLRKLDFRMSSEKYDELLISSKSGGTHFAVQVYFNKLLSKEEDLINSLRHVFQDSQKRLLSREEAEKLIKEGWHWVETEENPYNPITPELVKKGFKFVSVSIEEYYKIKGRIDVDRNSRGGIAPEVVDKQVKDSLYKLQGKKNLYKLYKEVKHLEEAIDWVDAGKISGLIAGSPLTYALALSYPELKEKYQEKKTELEAELAKLGITLEEFEKSINDFIKNFQTFASLTALRMLDNNETKTRIALTQLENEENIKEIKKIISKLNPLYKGANENWWRGVAKELSVEKYAKEHGINLQVTDDKSLEAFLAEVHKKDRLDGYLAILNEVGKRALATIFHGLDTPNKIYKLYAIYRYADGKEGFLNDYFKEAQQKELEANKILLEGAQKYNILAYPDLDLKEEGEDYVGMNDPELQKKLMSFIDSDGGILENIKKIGAELRNNPSKIWELKPVWSQAMMELGLTEEDPQHEIILKEVERRKDEKFWRDILLAVGGIALGLLALASGPLGWAALAGSVAVGIVDAAIQYEEISFMRSARRTALDPKDALSDVDPSWVWFYVSLAGIGLDVFDAVKLIKAAKLAKNADELVSVTKEGLQKAINELGVLGEKTAEQIKTLEDFKAALHNIDNLDFKNNLNILLKLQDNPLALSRLAEAMANKDTTKAFRNLGKELGENSDLFLSALKFYGGIGNDLAEELPEVLRIVKSGGLKNQPELLEEIFTQPSLQKVLLDHPNDPRLLTHQWEAWNTAGRKASFISHLKSAGFDTDLTKGANLTPIFGKGFAQLPNLAKNRQLLRQIEPRLMNSLDANTLSHNVQQAILLHLSDDILGTTDDLTRASKRIHEVLGPIIGGELTKPGDFAKVAELIDDPAFVSKIFGSASNLPGKDVYSDILKKLIAKHKPSQDVLDDLARIGVVTDESTLERLMTNTALREMLAENPLALKALKRCASPCFPTTLTDDQILKLNALLKDKGLGGEQFRRLNEYIYLHREILEKGEFDKFFTHLSGHFDHIVNGKVNLIPNEELLIDPSKLLGLGAKIGSEEVRSLTKSLKETFSNLSLTGTKTIENIIKRGVPESLLNDVLNAATAKGLTPLQTKELMENINRGMGIALTGEMRQMGKVLYGLSDSKTFDQAQNFLGIMKTYNWKHADVFDDILTRLEFNDLARFPVPPGISAPYFFQTIAHFKSLIDGKIVDADHVAIIAQKLSEPASKGINLDELMELKRILSSGEIQKETEILEYILGKLKTKHQNLKDFIQRELKDKSITTEIIPKLRARQPNATLREALQVILKDDADLSFFNSLPNGSKQLAILANTEPEMAAFLESILYGTNRLKDQLGVTIKKGVTIDPTLQSKIISALEKIDIPDPDNILVGSIREKVVKKVNEVLGQNLSIGDIRKLDDILEEQGSRGSIFEHWLRENKPAPLTNLQKGETLKFGGNDVHLDSQYFEGGERIAVEAKNLEQGAKLSSNGHQANQLKTYADMVANGKLKRVEYVFSNKISAENSLIGIEAAFVNMEGAFKVFYIDSTGKLVNLN